LRELPRLQKNKNKKKTGIQSLTSLVKLSKKKASCIGLIIIIIIYASKKKSQLVWLLCVVVVFSLKKSLKKEKDNTKANLHF